MQLYVEHSGAAVVTVQRGMGRQGAAAGITSTPTYPIPAGPASFPAQSQGIPIMVGEPLVLKTSGAVVNNIRVLAIVVAVSQ
jgi:hypothetical protein